MSLTINLRNELKEHRIFEIIYSYNHIYNILFTLITLNSIHFLIQDFMKIPGIMLSIPENGFLLSFLSVFIGMKVNKMKIL